MNHIKIAEVFKNQVKNALFFVKAKYGTPHANQL